MPVARVMRFTAATIPTVLTLIRSKQWAVSDGKLHYAVAIRPSLPCTTTTPPPRRLCQRVAAPVQNFTDEPTVSCNFYILVKESNHSIYS